MFTSESLEVFLRDFLFELPFPDNALTLHITGYPEGIVKKQESKPEGEEEKEEEKKEEDKIPEGVDEDTLLRHCLTRYNISDFGLGYLFEICKELVINRDFIESLYRTLIRIAMRKVVPAEVLPEMPAPKEDEAEPTEEEKKEIDKKIDEVKHRNTEAEKTNEDVLKV
jgi:hypothetical protein